MKLKLYCVAVLLLGFVSLAQAEESHVGEIRHSLLTLKQFQGKYGTEWELMKGQAIPGDSELLPLWGQPKIPDSRGVFLRCSQAERSDEMGNPDGDLPLGTYQADDFKEHNHGGGKHHHSVSFELTASRNPVGHVKNTVADWPQNQRAVRTTDSGNIIDKEGDKETRPRCIIVNAFIKIRESAPVPASNTINPELKNEIINSPEFKAAVDKIFKTNLDRSF